MCFSKNIYLSFVGGLVEVHPELVEGLIIGVDGALGIEDQNAGRGPAHASLNFNHGTTLKIKN